MNQDILKNIWDILSSEGATNSDFETWKTNFSGSEEVQVNVHKYLVKGGYTESDYDTWKTNVGVKKKDSFQPPGTAPEENTEFTTQPGQQDGSLVSGEKPVRERSYIENQIDVEIEDAPRDILITKRGNIVHTGYKDDDQGVTYDQELSDALYADAGIQKALELGKLTEKEIKNATSNKKFLRAKALEKIKEFRYKSDDEIEEIIKKEKLDTPFLYENLQKDDGFIKEVYGNIDGLRGINKEDFNGFITSSGLKADYLNKIEKGLYDSSSNYAWGQKENKLQIMKEMDELRMITLYLEDVQTRDRRFQELDYRKNNQGLSMKATDYDYMPTNYVDPTSLIQFIKKNMPNYVEHLQQQRVKAEAQYQKYKDNKTGVGFSLWEASKSFGSGVDDRINQLTATIFDKVGADTAATDIRMAEEYENLTKDPSFHYTYVSGKKIKVGGVEYIVNKNGNIFDVDHKANVSGILDAQSQNIIRKEAKNNGEEASSISAQGAIIDTSGILGGIVVDLALTKGVSLTLPAVGGLARGLGVLGTTMKTLKNVPISRGMASAFIAQSSIGFSSGIENTLREAKLAGLNDTDAQELAVIAGREMALLYGLTSFISPQIKATEALFGNINTSSILNKALQSAKKGGKVNPITFAARIKEIGYKVLDYQGEGMKELIQENVQQAGERFVVNRDINERAAKKIMVDTISGDEFINTSILSYVAGMLIPGAGELSSGAISLFTDNNIDKLQMLGLLNEKKDKAIAMMDDQVANNKMTLQQRDNVVNQMEVYAGSINFIPSNLDAETATTIMEDVYEINELEQQKEKTKIKAVKNSLDKKIEEANQRIDAAVNFGDLAKSKKKELKEQAKQKLQKQNPNRSITEKEILDYAIQEQSTKDVDVSQYAKDSTDVAEDVSSEPPSGEGEAENQNKVKKEAEEEIEAINKKIIETREHKKLTELTKKTLIAEFRKKREILQEKINDINAEQKASPKVKKKVKKEVKKEVEQELTEKEKFDKESRLTPEEVKEAQKEEEYTAKQTEGNYFSKKINQAKRIFKKYFGMRGNQPMSLFGAKEMKQTEANSILFKASRKAAQFANFFDKLRKTGRVSDKALKQLNEDLSKVLKGEMNIKDIKFKNKNGEVKRISAKLADLIVKMRQDIDAMSQQILDAPNILKDGTRESIQENFGKYVTRSYRLFEGSLSGAEFRKTLKKEVVEEAKEFFRKEVKEAQKAEEEIEAINKKIIETKENKKLTELTKKTLIAELRKKKTQLNKKDKSFLKEVKGENKKLKEKFETTLERMVDQKINDLLSDTTTAKDFINKFAGKGQKRGILKRRKEIPEPIRKLYGEITDPVANYITTMSKMGTLLSTANFIQSLYDNGIGRYIFTKNDPNRKEGTVEISSKDNENYKPLDGLYTYPELVENLFPKDSRVFWAQNPIADAYLKYFMAYPRAAKTVLSLSTQVINFVSNVNFAAINGHLPISLMNGTMGLDSYTKAVKGVAGILSNKSDAELGKIIELYYKLGIIDQSVDVRELRDMLKESTTEEDLLKRFTQEPAYKTEGGIKVLGKQIPGTAAVEKGAKKVFKEASKLYRVGDDFWKIMGFEQESKILAKVLYDKEVKDLTESELKQVQEDAAEMVKNQYPTYSRIPRIGKILKASPIVGNFISFQLESYRTAWNTVFGKQGALQTINKGNVAGKDTPLGKRLRKEGFRKLANMLGYMGLRDGAFYALAKFTGGKVLGGILPMLGMAGYDDKEPRMKEKRTLGNLTAKEIAIRNFVYNWQKNSKLIVFKASDGQLKFVDATTFDPFQSLDRAVNVMLQSKTGLDVLQGTALENLETFASLDFVIDAFFKSQKNYKKKGPAGDLFNDFLRPFATRAWLPGTLLQIEDAVGKGFISGRKLDESKIGKLLGYREYDIDVEKQLYFNLEPKRRAQLKGENTYKGKVWTVFNELKEKGLYSESDITNLKKDLKAIDETYETVNDARKDSWLFALDQVLSALILGANPEKIRNTLQGTNIGFTKKEVDVLIRFSFLPMKKDPTIKTKPESELQKALKW